MSTASPETDSATDPLSGRRLLVRVIALVLALGSLLVLWVGERAKADHDLQILVQKRARAGASVAVRAALFRGLESVAGPRLSTAPVELRALDAGGRELTRVRLNPGATTMEGVLAVPASATGEIVLDAQATLDNGRVARCRRSLRIVPEGGGLTPAGRVAGGLQHFALGRLRTLGEAPPPSALDVRIPGGVCIPEQPCLLLVRVGEPAAAIEVEASAAVTPDGVPQPHAETTGLVRVSVVVHGPEADLTVRALRGGDRVAERSVRLPVGLGEVSLALQTPVIDVGDTPQLAVLLPPGRQQFIVDAYRAGDWLQSVSARAPDRPGTWQPLPFSVGAPGLWRIQARVDPFSTDGAGARALYVRAPGEDDIQMLWALDALGAPPGQARLFSDPASLPTWALADPEEAAAYLLAPLERVRMPQPTAVSGRPAQLRRVRALRTWLRFAVGATLVLAALVVSGSMVRRELGEQTLTREALRAAGDESIDTPESRRTQAFWLYSMALGVALAFLLAALMIVAKPLWF